MSALHITLADAAGLAWAQQTVTRHHYLRRPVDPRCSPLAYLVMVDDEAAPMGTLIFGRLESTVCRPFYGGLDDLAAGRVRLSRWQVLNLARVYLDPAIQQGGARYIPNAATMAMSQAIRRVVVDYLLRYPLVYANEPYEILLALSYCDPRYHRGTLYKAANFSLARTNERGLQTWTRPLRRLQPHEDRVVLAASERDSRARRLRAKRSQLALPMGEGVAV